ncbi:MAG: hypothetical protein PF904_21165 [Kiritimatiellae bacterium]|jgi:hypothetical protein|nr:hypothetical protein [Kiritimatiellia bacterium]
MIFNRIKKDIVITTKEGIQPDFSFYQHGDQFYSGGSGRGFISSGLNFYLYAKAAFSRLPVRCTQTRQPN